jgi:hypothetical protein
MTDEDLASYLPLESNWPSKQTQKEIITSSSY